MVVTDFDGFGSITATSIGKKARSGQNEHSHGYQYGGMEARNEVQKMLDDIDCAFGLNVANRPVQPLATLTSTRDNDCYIELLRSLDTSLLYIHYLY